MAIYYVPEGPESMAHRREGVAGGEKGLLEEGNESGLLEVVVGGQGVG
jgi:hypothetical protein